MPKKGKEKTGESWFMKMVKNRLDGKPVKEEGTKALVPARGPEPVADRKEFLRQARNQLLKNHGLPPDTPPDQVMQKLKDAEPQNRVHRNRVAFLKKARERMLGNLRLPSGTKPEQVHALLELRQLMDRLNERAKIVDAKKRRKK